MLTEIGAAVSLQSAVRPSERYKNPTTVSKLNNFRQFWMIF